MNYVVSQKHVDFLNVLSVWANRIYSSVVALLSKVSVINERDQKAIEHESAFSETEEAFDKYGNSILRLAYSYLHNMSDAEDILQDTLIKFMECAHSFESEEHKKAWLLRVTANLSKNKIDYNRIRQTDELEENLIAEEREDLSFVWEAVKALPEKYREVIHLFYQEGYSSKEISRILKRNESSVRSDLKRGRECLKEILKEAYDFEI